MKTFFELFPTAKIPVTEQGALTVNILIVNRETKEEVRRETIKRALLAKLMNEHKILGLNGEFVLEI